MIAAVLITTLGACNLISGPENTTTTIITTTTTTLAPTTTEAPVDECPGGVFCVKYNIHPDAAWADGVPVTADDFAFTFETLTDSQIDIASRTGYTKMIGYEIVDDKTFLAIFGEPYSPWQNLFSQVLPKHELEGQDFNTYWDDKITLGSGPFVMDDWVKDDRIVLKRNENYWASEDPASGAPLGDVKTVNITFYDDLTEQIQALKDEEIDMFYPQRRIAPVDEIDGIEGVDWETGLGAVWEHIDFNQDDPLLSKHFIRQAIATGIDRDAIVEAVVRPLAPEAVPLGNTVWLNTSSNYEDHFTQYDYDPLAAEAYLTENGCVKGEDGIYECDGQRVSFNWVTTAGHEQRELQFALAQANLEDIGIEVIADFGPASEVFTNEYFYGDSSVWQMFNFAWVGSPDPASSNSLYQCSGDAPNGFGVLNVSRYCNEEIERLVNEADMAVNPAERAALYNEADALYLDDVASIPLYQKPTLFVWRSDIEGPKDNATQVGPFWNIASWTGRDLVTFGADEEPKSMNGLEPAGAGFPTALPAGAVLEGAFTILPDFSYKEQLITSAETIIPSR